MPFPYPVEHLKLSQSASLAYRLSDEEFYCPDCTEVLSEDGDMVFVARDCGLHCAGCRNLLGKES